MASALAARLEDGPTGSCWTRSTSRRATSSRPSLPSSTTAPSTVSLECLRLYEPVRNVRQDHDDQPCDQRFTEFHAVPSDDAVAAAMRETRLASLPDLHAAARARNSAALAVATHRRLRGVL